MPMINGLPDLPSGVLLNGTEEVAIDVETAPGVFTTYKTTTGAIADLAGGQSGGGGGGGVQLGNVNVFTKNQSVAPVALIDGANIAVDASLSNNFALTLGGNHQLDNPTGLTDGMVLSFVITEDGTGGWALAFDTMFKFDSGTLPVFDTAAGAVNYISAQYDAGNDILICGALVGVA